MFIRLFIRIEVNFQSNLTEYEPFGTNIVRMSMLTSVAVRLVCQPSVWSLSVSHYDFSD